MHPYTLDVAEYYAKRNLCNLSYGLPYMCVNFHFCDTLSVVRIMCRMRTLNEEFSTDLTSHQVVKLLKQSSGECSQLATDRQKWRMSMHAYG